MQLHSIQVERFRCLRELHLSLDDVTVLVGANGSGKSSTLHSLEWLFRGGPLEPADIYGRADDGTVTVQATFTDLSVADRAALGALATRDGLTIRRTWSTADGEEVTATAPAYPLFAPLRAFPTATPFKQAYEQLQKQHPELDLPRYRNFETGRQALTDWEMAHPDQLQPMQITAAHLFSRANGAGLAGRFDYVLVPAVADAEQQTRDARGTLLRRLLERITIREPELEHELDEVTAEYKERLGKLLAEGHAAALDALAMQLTDGLRRYVEGTSVTLEVRPPDLRPPSAEIALRVDDGGGLIDPSRQGHGVQRALVMALVQHLAEPTAPSALDGGDPPALLLAIEEPELYQHPLQARHLARVLASLPERSPGTIQVAYATHSAHFVDTSRYERLRRFSKAQGPAAVPSYATVRAATVEAVTNRLSGVVPSEQVPWRIAETLRRRLAEAVFAHAVLLVEGGTDAGLYCGVADQNAATNLDANGVAVVIAGGKTLMPLMWAILVELGIPVYVVFDGDARIGDRMRAGGKSEQEIAAALTATKDANRSLLRLLGETKTAWPPTQVTARYATLHDRLEQELANTWPAMIERATALASVQGRDAKNGDCYYQAALQTPNPPGFAQDIIAAARAHANSPH